MPECNDWANDELTSALSLIEGSRWLRSGLNSGTNSDASVAQASKQRRPTNKPAKSPTRTQSLPDEDQRESSAENKKHSKVSRPELNTGKIGNMAGSANTAGGGTLSGDTFSSGCRRMQTVEGPPLSFGGCLAARLFTGGPQKQAEPTVNSAGHQEGFLAREIIKIPCS